MALSKSRLKFIRSLEQKKFRREAHAFLAEGPKLVTELLGHFQCQLLAATGEWLHAQQQLPATEIIEITDDELNRASLLRTPQQVLAVFHQPEDLWEPTLPAQQLCLALDNIQDPGNLGTIVRLADWFGIEHIFCSPNSADIYSPKAIQATMGGISHVQIHYTDLPSLIENAGTHLIYGTFLDGTDIYTTSLTDNGLIVMGNEGNGISHEVSSLITKKLYIPNYPPARETTDSLNVATATAIICAEFRRQAVRK